MLDALVQFLDVHGDYEAQQSVLVKFEYASLATLLNKARERLRTQVSAVLVQLSYWDCVEAIADDDMRSPFPSQRGPAKSD